MATNKSARARAAGVLAKKVASSLSAARLGRSSGQATESQALATRALKDLIEEERTRLMAAESVLECAMLAMDETDHAQADGPYYQNVIGVARDLILQSIDQLDSVRLGPIFQQLALRGGHGVEEHVTVYLH